MKSSESNLLMKWPKYLLMMLSRQRKNILYPCWTKFIKKSNLWKSSWKEKSVIKKLTQIFQQIPVDKIELVEIFFPALTNTEDCKTSASINECF